MSTCAGTRFKQATTKGVRHHNTDYVRSKDKDVLFFAQHHRASSKSTCSGPSYSP